MSKNYLGIIIILICSLFLLVGCNDGKVDYQLQEQCKKSSEEFYRKQYHSDFSSYQNHYNKKLHKCFIILTTETYTKGNQTDVMTGKSLFDVNENKEYGDCTNFEKTEKNLCKFLGKLCESEKEWDSLVKPYMEE